MNLERGKMPNGQIGQLNGQRRAVEPDILDPVAGTYDVDRLNSNGRDPPKNPLGFQAKKD